MVRHSSSVPRARVAIRTCVGCRQKEAATELLRVVIDGARGEHGGVAVVVPDPARRLPGRGASLHPDPACLALAERRRAFGRALRVAGVLDIGRVREYLAGLGVSPEVRATSPHPEEK